MSLVRRTRPNWQKANTQGITVVSSTGDSGAAECDNQFGSGTNTTNLAQHGIAVTYPASSPEVTAVGGNFTDFSNLPPLTSLPTAQWNNAIGTDGGSMFTPIPEIAWNDDVEMGAFCAANPTTNFCVNSHITDAQSAQAFLGLEAGGGGVSNCATLNSTACVSGFPQPTWQNSLSIAGQTSGPTGFRFLPDVSLLASPNFPGYIFCTQQTALGLTGTGSACAPGGAAGIKSALALSNSPIIGGTSAGTPVFAGMVALLNQFLAGPNPFGLGNINPMLYSLAAAPANNYFHHVNTGTNNLFCTAGTPTTQPPAYQCPGGGILSFDSATADATTGIQPGDGPFGSVDLNNLAVAWDATRAASTVAVSSSPTSATVGQSVTLTASVTPTTAVGNVDFLNSGTAIGTAALCCGVATFATTSLPAGAFSITAQDNGDGVNRSQPPRPLSPSPSRRRRSP